MATFTGTESDDTFTATSGADTLYFGENQGVDLIFKFNPAQDRLAYTDRSVDGFDDLEITRLQNGDAVIESNDQYTVLQGVDPDDLVGSDFVFTTSGPRGDISDSRSSARQPPQEVNVHDIQQREAAAGYPTSTPSSGSGAVSLGSGTGSSGRLGGFLGGLFGGLFGGLLGGGRLMLPVGQGSGQTYDVTGPNQTVSTSGSVTVENHNEPNTTFVFDPGHGTAVIHQFVVNGSGHNTLSFPQSDFTSIADVLRHTQATSSGAVIHDPATGDVVRLTGVSKAELTQNRRDVAFQA